jgi:hypothetical protein
MPEFEPDQESVSQAEQLSSRLMANVRTASQTGIPSDGERGLFSAERFSTTAAPIEDVLLTVRQMTDELAFAKRWSGRVPCLRFEDGEWAILSVGNFMGPNFAGLEFGPEWIEDYYHISPYPVAELIYRQVERQARNDDSVKMIENNEAIELVSESLKSFLAYRIAGMKSWREWIQQGFSSSGRSGGGTPPPTIGGAGGLQVQVACQTPGLRIHIARAYFVNWTVFGAPSSPVTSFVQPGRYIFSGDGPMLPKRTRDTGVYRIPPSFNPVLTKF